MTADTKKPELSPYAPLEPLRWYADWEMIAHQWKVVAHRWRTAFLLVLGPCIGSTIAVVMLLLEHR